MTPVVVEAEFEVSEAIDGRLSGNGTNNGTNLVLQSDILVARSLRDEIRTLQVERSELVCHDRLVRVFQWLG